MEVGEDGPYHVTGIDLFRIGKVRNEAGRPVAWERKESLETHDGETWLCRCGGSAMKPFCDGTHRKKGFDGTETADRGPSAGRRREFAGEEYVLTDDTSLCEHAGFCVREDTKAWTLVRHADGPEAGSTLLEMVHHCPSGRLEIREAGGEAPIEPDLPPEVAVVDDGPLWVRGRVRIVAADGEAYEVRNRVTLCRCGRSRNKPFCDGTHAEAGFRDS